MTTNDTTTQYLERPDGKIGYDVSGPDQIGPNEAGADGARPLIVLVPGMGELRSSYRFLTPALVAAGYTVASTDLRGHGDSDTTFASYGDTQTSDDIIALIAKIGGPAIIVGNSLAAGAAVIVAAERPELTAGLVLVGPYVRNPKVNAVMLAMFRAMMAPTWIARVWKSYMPTLYKGIKPDDFDEYRAKVYASLKRPAYAKAFSRTTRETDHAPAEAKLSEVNVPVLVIMGEKDPDFKDPAAEANWIGKTLQAEVVLAPESGHYPHAQQPELTADAVLGFLNKVGHPA